MQGGIVVNLIAQTFLGIFTGILTTAILFGLKWLWDQRLHPFLREMRYSGVMIAGLWEGHVEDQKENSSAEMRLFLKQSARDLSGTFNIRHTSPTNNYEILHDVIGHIWEGYVVLNFTPTDRRITSYSTALLKIDGGGVGLTGKLAFRDVFQEGVLAEDLQLSRSNFTFGTN